MKVNGIQFVYRGTQTIGHELARLLEEISVEYTIGSIADNDSTHVSTDLGALLQTLDERVITKPKQPTVIRTAVPPVHVRDRNVLQWLRAMNVPIGVPITLQFVDDLSSKGLNL
jgi:hypothetical protein